MQILKTLDRASSDAVNTGEDYLELTKRYYKLKIFQQLTSNFAALCKMAIIGGIVFLGIIFLSVAGAIAFGNAVDNLPLGYVAMATVLILIALVIYMVRKKLVDRFVLKKMSKTFFDD
ncbi:hypothetical protein [Allomuricauda sp. d1]|uniref:hypothetical protein n=1 Tax=Allomuricauda sp. d1 TaxID=3136725 RepID=UPI0031D0FE7A